MIKSTDRFCDCLIEIWYPSYRIHLGKKEKEDMTQNVLNIKIPEIERLQNDTHFG